MAAPLLRRYRSTFTLVIGWAVVVVAALSLVDAALRSTSGARIPSAMLAVGLALIAWVWALRPAVQERSDALEVVNPLRRADLPWGSITEIDGADVVRVHAGDLVVRCFALPRRPGPARTRPTPGAPAADPFSGFADDPLIRFDQLRDQLARPGDGPGRYRYEPLAVAALVGGLLLVAAGGALLVAA